jgi:cytochrome c-type biogenesis protein CcmH
MDGSIGIWLAIAAMTCAAVFAVLIPLSRQAASAADARDVAVYKDQLAEVDRDAAAGLIGPAEAEAARIEVSRRLIAAAERAEAAGAVREGTTRRRRIAAIAAIVLVPAIAALTYGLRGQPGYPGQPLAERQRAAPQQSDFATLIGRVETHLSANPDDGRGWEVIAPVYLRMGRVQDAVRARANAMRLLGVTADREADLAEAQTIAAGGVVSAEAKAGFERALALGPGHPKAGYFLGLAAEQDGKPDEARAQWTRMIGEAPEGAPWVALLRSEIARLGGTPPQTAAAAAPPAQPGPAQIRAMVEGLAQRLAADGSDFDSWLRLVRSYVVLGEGDKAREAAASARRLFAAQPDKIGRLDSLVNELGIGGS